MSGCNGKIMTYRPLPFIVELKKSTVHGQGIFAISKLAKGITVGRTHVEIYIDSKFEDIIRTPLGGFVNHSDKPNCRRIVVNSSLNAGTKIKQHYLETIKNIKKGEELTLKYTWYRVNKKQLKKL